jgi:hypothetical protein
MRAAVRALFFIGVLVSCEREQPRADEIRGDTAIVELRPPGAAPETASTDTQSSKPSENVVTVPVLTKVRIAVHEGADRIVFEFDGPLPGYRIEYIDRPVRQCGSGEVVELPGDAWLGIRFFPANAHTEKGERSVALLDYTFSGRNLKRLKLICDFEAVVEWVAAVAHPLPYKTLELKAPDRLAIDLGKGE